MGRFPLLARKANRINLAYPLIQETTTHAGNRQLFIIHWYASVFAQSFFLHRYMAHRMFTMNPFWERFFYLFTFLAQGSSFLHPKSYAQLHLEHHNHSDTEEDPHSPHFWKDVFSMMVNTGRVYMDFKTGKRESTSPYIERMPTWNLVDRLGDNHLVRLAFCAAYVGIYWAFAPTPGFSSCFLPISLWDPFTEHLSIGVDISMDIATTTLRIIQKYLYLGYPLRR